MNVPGVNVSGVNVPGVDGVDVVVPVTDVDVRGGCSWRSSCGSSW